MKDINKEYEYENKCVMCVNDWAEDNYQDFVVFKVIKGETEEQAIERAKKAYSPKDTFYIKNL